jgi:hypothetical protein
MKRFMLEGITQASGYIACEGKGMLLRYPTHRKSQLQLWKIVRLKQHDDKI